MSAYHRSAAPGEQLGKPLSPRQREILALVAHGHTNREIATLLVISPHTVHAALRIIYARLGVSGRAQAALAARDRSLV